MGWPIEEELKRRRAFWMADLDLDERGRQLGFFPRQMRPHRDREPSLDPKPTRGCPVRGPDPNLIGAEVRRGIRPRAQSGAFYWRSEYEPKLDQRGRRREDGWI